MHGKKYNSPVTSPGPMHGILAGMPERANRTASLPLTTPATPRVRVQRFTDRVPGAGRGGSCDPGSL